MSTTNNVIYVKIREKDLKTTLFFTNFNSSVRKKDFILLLLLLLTQTASSIPKRFKKSSEAMWPNRLNKAYRFKPLAMQS